MGFAVRGRHAGAFTDHQRALLRDAGYDLRWSYKLEERYALGDGRDFAEKLLAAEIPFTYKIYRYNNFRYPIEHRVTPGLPLDADRALSALETMAGSLSPLHASIVQGTRGDSAAIEEETLSLRAAEARGDHPDVIITGGEIYKVAPAVDPDAGPWGPRGGFGGQGFTITYPDGVRRHTYNLMHQGTASDPRFLPNATIEADPYRDSSHETSNLTDEQRARYLRHGTALIQPPVMASGERPHALGWDDPKAVAFLDRGAIESLLKVGATHDVLSRNPEGAFFGEIVTCNERWVGVMDADGNVTAHRLLDPELSDVVFNSSWNRRDRAFIELQSVGGTVQSLALVERSDRRTEAFAQAVASVEARRAAQLTHEVDLLRTMHPEALPIDAAIAMLESPVVDVGADAPSDTKLVERARAYLEQKRKAEWGNLVATWREDDPIPFGPEILADVDRYTPLVARQEGGRERFRSHVLGRYSTAAAGVVCDGDLYHSPIEARDGEMVWVVAIGKTRRASDPEGDFDVICDASAAVAIALPPQAEAKARAIIERLPIDAHRGELSSAVGRVRALSHERPQELERERVRDSRGR